MIPVLSWRRGQKVNPGLEGGRWVFSFTSKPECSAGLFIDGRVENLQKGFYTSGSLKVRWVADFGVQEMSLPYYVFHGSCVEWRNDVIQAKLVTPHTSPKRMELPNQDCGYGFCDPSQKEPYKVDLNLTYEVDPRWPHNDRYFTDYNFLLYSTRLVELLEQFGVAGESFPARMVDRKGRDVPGLSYRVFHYLEPLSDCLDAEASGWDGNHRNGVRTVVLDEARLPDRAIIHLDHLYVYLMREDLRNAMRYQQVTGLSFVQAKDFCSRKQGNTGAIPWES